MNGLPLHPLVVHLPVVLVPLVALLTLPALFSRRWFRWAAPSTLALSLVAALGAWAATWSGESLMESLGQSSDLLRQHAQAGEMSRNLAALLFLVLLAHTALFWHRSPAATRAIGTARPVLHTVLGVVGAATAVSAVLAGHAGAQLVWQGTAG